MSALRLVLVLNDRAPAERAAPAAQHRYLSQRAALEAPHHHPPQRCVHFTGSSSSALSISLPGDFDRAQAYSKRDKSGKVTPLGQRLKAR